MNDRLHRNFFISQWINNEVEIKVLKLSMIRKYVKQNDKNTDQMKKKLRNFEKFMKFVKLIITIKFILINTARISRIKLSYLD